MLFTDSYLDGKIIKRDKEIICTEHKFFFFFFGHLSGDGEREKWSKEQIAFSGETDDVHGLDAGTKSKSLMRYSH